MLFAARNSRGHCRTVCETFKSSYLLSPKDMEMQIQACLRFWHLHTQAAVPRASWSAKHPLTFVSPSGGQPWASHIRKRSQSSQGPQKVGTVPILEMRKLRLGEVTCPELGGFWVADSWPHLPDLICADFSGHLPLFVFFLRNPWSGQVCHPA